MIFLTFKEDKVLLIEMEVMIENGINRALSKYDRTNRSHSEEIKNLKNKINFLGKCSQNL